LLCLLPPVCPCPLLSAAAAAFAGRFFPGFTFVERFFGIQPYSHAHFFTIGTQFNSWHQWSAARNFVALGRQLHQTGAILKLDPTQRSPYAYGKR